LNSRLERLGSGGEQIEHLKNSGFVSGFFLFLFLTYLTFIKY